MKNKKGFEVTIGVLITVILIGVALFILFPVVSTISAYMSTGGEEAVCMLSLIGGANKARCPVEQVAILPDSVEIKKPGETKGQVLKPSVQNSANFNKEMMARLLKNCMDKGGGVNSKAFSRENVKDPENVCLQCYTVEIKSSAQIDGILPYLSATKSPRGRLYLDELTIDDAHKKAYILYGTVRSFAPSNSEPTMRSGTQYTIFFIGQKKGAIPAFIETATSIPEYGIGKAFLQNNDAFFSFVTESSKIGETCQRLVN
jgi:hypothetical protein